MNEPPALRGVGRRIAAARRLLAARGLAGARPGVAGHRHEILTLAADPSDAERLRALAPALKEIGFRYVALELDAGSGQASSEP